MKRGQGQGKTMLFAYLSRADKARVLQLSEAAGADSVATQPHGKTGFFAGLPGEVKYNALMAWQRERDETLTEADRTGPPENRQLMKLFVLTAIPMVGFGFADNFLMIFFGDAIEEHFGLVWTVNLGGSRARQPL